MPLTAQSPPSPSTLNRDVVGGGSGTEANLPLEQAETNRPSFLQPPWPLWLIRSVLRQDYSEGSGCATAVLQPELNPRGADAGGTAAEVPVKSDSHYFFFVAFTKEIMFKKHGVIIAELCLA